jgi:hypothetical protein
MRRLNVSLPVAFVPIGLLGWSRTNQRSGEDDNGRADSRSGVRKGLAHRTHAIWIGGSEKPRARRWAVSPHSTRQSRRQCWSDGQREGAWHNSHANWIRHGRPSCGRGKPVAPFNEGATCKQQGPLRRGQILSTSAYCRFRLQAAEVRTLARG